MHNVIGLLLIGLCIGWVVWTLRHPTPLTMFMSLSSIFTVGYYGLPILLIERSSLRYLPEAEISTTIGMSMLFFVMISVGFIAVMRRGWGSTRNFSFGPIDRLLEQHWWPVTIASNVLFIVFLTTQAQSAYQFESFDAYLASKSIWSSIIAFFSGLFQAFTAINFVRALQWRSNIRIMAAGFGLLVQLGLVAMNANRSLFIAPFLLVIGAMVMFRLNRMAGMTLAIAIAALLAYSPFAVAVRAGSWNGAQDIAAEQFSYGENAFDTALQSIVDRGDILQSNSILKAHTDAYGHPGWKYYYSVLMLPVPRFFYRSKPYLLSDTGDMNGEASILAWHLSVASGPGSLTAFGAIIAYREGGWIWLCLNGLITGGLYAYFLTVLSRGRYISQAFFITAIYNWGVRKVPPSLFELLADVMTYLPLILILLIVSRIMVGSKLDLDLIGDHTPGDKSLAPAE